MLLRCEEVGYTYPPGLPALRGVSLEISPGDFVCLAGPAGAGKSTLAQLLKGLLVPTEGRVLLGGVDTRRRGKELEAARRRIGFVFQFPEQQLFAETVAEDVAFGPRNLGLTEGEVKARVEEALTLVGLAPSSFGARSPFSLSTGEMRRVAIAGVLALRPAVLILDEPTSGLDPRGRRELWELLAAVNRQGVTVVVISHLLGEAARYARRLVLLAEGKLVFDGSFRAAFSTAPRLLESLGLGPPTLSRLLWKLRERGLPVRTALLGEEEIAEEILCALRGNACVS